MKTKPVTITVQVPDNGKPHHITAVIADSDPPSHHDHDRVRDIHRQVWFVGVDESEARPVG